MKLFLIRSTTTTVVHVPTSSIFLFSNKIPRLGSKQGHKSVKAYTITYRPTKGLNCIKNTYNYTIV